MSLLPALPFCLPLSGLTWWYCLNENFNIKDWYWYSAVMFFFVSVQCVICKDLRLRLYNQDAVEYVIFSVSLYILKTGGVIASLLCAGWWIWEDNCCFLPKLSACEV